MCSYVLLILFTLSGGAFYFLFFYTDMKHQLMIGNHQLRIFKGYYISIHDDTYSGKNVLFHHKNQIDIVKGLREKFSGWYIITEQGYYVFSRFNRKIIFLEDINSQNDKVKKIFCNI